MKVSIIIPVYNVEKYIERCINSVIKQTFTNLECIIVDDCSQDNSLEICKRIINKYNGPITFKIITHKHSEGPSGARNTGTKAAKGDYIFYLDSDDEITNDCIYLMYNATIKYPQAEIVQGCTISENKTIYHSLDNYKDIEYINDNNWIRREFYQFKDTLPILVWNKLIKKAYLNKHRIYFKEHIIHEDILWVYNIVKNLKHLCFIHENTYIHYTVPMSIMTSLKKERSNESWAIILSEVSLTLDEPYFKFQIRKFLYEYITRFHNEQKYRYILHGFIKKSIQKKHYYISMALIIYSFFHKRECANSLKQWLITYCVNGDENKLLYEIFYDFKYYIKKTIKCLC